MGRVLLKYTQPKSKQTALSGIGEALKDMYGAVGDRKTLTDMYNVVGDCKIFTRPLCCKIKWLNISPQNSKSRYHSAHLSYVCPFAILIRLLRHVCITCTE